MTVLYTSPKLIGVEGERLSKKKLEMTDMAFVTKDSGQREEYPTGMVRDTQEGKPDYTLVDFAYLKRWAELMARGAVKYGRDNWRRASTEEELERFKASALRHMYQWLEGDESEDHSVACSFNLAAAEMVKQKLKEQQKGNSSVGNTSNSEDSGEESSTSEEGGCKVGGPGDPYFNEACTCHPGD